jgi:hypothetical protein
VDWRLVPLTVDGLIYASSMVMLDSARRKVRVPLLARWLLALGSLRRWFLVTMLTEPGKPMLMVVDDEELVQRAHLRAPRPT